MTDFGDDIADGITAARNRAVGSIYDDPEEAARALQLSQFTGTPATAIHGDIDGFVADQKAQTSSYIVRNNPTIAAYINSHPLAAAVSNDDLGALDQASKSINATAGPSAFQRWLKSDSIAQSAVQAIEGMANPSDRAAITGGWGDQPFGQTWIAKKPNETDEEYASRRPRELDWAISNPLGSLVPIIGANAVEAIGRATSAALAMGHDNAQSILGSSLANYVFGGLNKAAGSAATAVGIPGVEGGVFNPTDQLINDMFGAVEMEMGRGDIGVPGAGGGIGLKGEPKGPLMQSIASVAKQEGLPAPDFSKADAIKIKSLADGMQINDLFGGDPPVGVHPMIDKAKELEAKDDKAKLREAVSDSNATATKGRSDEMFSNFVHGSDVGDEEVGIDPEAIRKIYGDKSPQADDNLLGWIPDLDKKLEFAEATGGYISVPKADFIAKVDPQLLAESLQDDILAREGGFSVNDTKIEAEPKEVLADPVPAVRGSAGLEPMMSVGDRKITLRRRGQPGAEDDELFSVPDSVREGGAGAEKHDFDLVDDKGNVVGAVMMHKEGKQLYVENIQAGTGADYFYQPNFLGPSLIRDLGRQLKALFPDVFGPDGKGITGYRATGARWAGLKEGQMPRVDVSKPVVKFDLGEDPQAFRDLLQPYWEGIGTGDEFQALRKPTELYTKNEAAIKSAVDEELARIAPGAESNVVSSIAHATNRTVRGLFTTSAEDYLPQIFTSLDRRVTDFTDMGKAKGSRMNALLSTARHEAIHHLYRMGLITDGEWAKLVQASKDGNWIDKFDVRERYKDRKYSESYLHEEAIADAYAAWKRGEVVTKDTGVFQRISDFIDAIHRRVKEILGREFTPEELFQEIDTGRVGRRDVDSDAVIARQKDVMAGQMPDAMRQAMMEGGHEVPEAPASQGEDPFLFEPKALGTTQADMARIEQLIREKNEDDLKHIQKREERKTTRSFNKELRERRTALRDQVREDLSTRPDLAADRTFTQSGAKIHPDSLTEDQRARLPKDYIQKKDGLPADQLAPVFGFQSGSALAERLAMLTEDRKRSGMSQRDYFNRLVDVETDRRLNAEYGGDNLKERLGDARDQALSEANLNLVHEETLRAGIATGTKPKFDRSDVRRQVDEMVGRTPTKMLDSRKLLAAAGKMGRKIEQLRTQGKYAEVYRRMQQRQFAAESAKKAATFEKQKETVDRLARTYGKTPTEETAAKIDQDYQTFIQQVLVNTGYKIGRTAGQLADAIKLASHNNLESFVAFKTAMGREINIPEWLSDLSPNNQLKVEDMTYDQFQQFHRFLKQMDANARDEKTINTDYGKQILNDAINKAFEAFPKALRPRDFDTQRPGVVATTGRALWWSLISTRALAKRLDRGDPKGFFTRQFADRATAADAAFVASHKLYMERLRKEIGTIKDGGKVVENDIFKHPETGRPIKMHQRDVYGVISQMGNPSSMAKLVRGWNIDPGELMGWLRQNSKPEDWVRAQKIGNIFKDLFAETNRTSKELSDMGIEAVTIKPLTDPWGNRHEGWYNPVTYEGRLPGKSQALMGAQGIEKPEFFRPSTNQSFAKERTGYTAPTDLSLDSIPVRMTQMIHYNAWQPAIKDMGKILFNRNFQQKFKDRLGEHRLNSLIDYVKDMANHHNTNSVEEFYRGQMLEYLRQNTTQALTGFNPSTITKHGITVAMNSLTQVGAKNFMREAVSLFRGNDEYQKTNFSMAMDKSEVLQDRVGNLLTAIKLEDPKFKFEPNKLGAFRDLMMKVGSYPTGALDLMSAVPTWLAKYKELKAAGEDEGFAIQKADAAVIEAHGSAMRSNRPAIVRQGGPIPRTLTSLYGIMSHILQKQYEIGWKARDMLNGEKPLDVEGSFAGHALGNTWSYWLYPAIIEELVTPSTNDERKSWGHKSLAALANTLSGGFPYVRDFVHGILHGRADPQPGLLGTMQQPGASLITDLTKDHPLNKAHAGVLVRDAIESFAVGSGFTNNAEGKAAQYVTDLLIGKAQPPRGMWQGGVGLRYGKTDKHSVTASEWWKHMTKEWTPR